MSETEILPECGPTIERIQSVLDRVHPAAILTTDSHAEACFACRERVRAAQRMLALFEEPVVVAVSTRFTESVLAGIQTDRRSRFRRRAIGLVAGCAAAAAFAIVVWINQPKPAEFVKQEPTPGPAEQPVPRPPIRVNAELAKAGEAIRETARGITEPAADTPRMVAALTETFLKTPTVAVSYDLGPAGKSLADIPEAARAGLEPVGNTAQKAFNRLLRDVASMQPKVKS
jgi:hypothetical protein